MIMIPFAVLLMIGGAILRWAVHIPSEYFDNKKAGLILLVSGIVIAALAATSISLHEWDRHHNGRMQGVYGKQTPGGFQPGYGMQRGFVGGGQVAPGQ